MLLRALFFAILVFVGAGSVAFAMPREKVEHTILSQIRESYRALCSECRVEFKQINFPEVKVKSLQEIHVVTEGVSWAGSFLLPLEIAGVRAGWISGQVRISKQGLVARRGLQPGEALSAVDVVQDWVDVTFLKDQLATLEDLGRLTPKKFLALRQPVLMSDLRKVFVIQRGQTIRITAGQGDFEITTSMKAEDNGAIGDLIRVKNTETQKVLSVRVEKEGQARME